MPDDDEFVTVTATGDVERYWDALFAEQRDREKAHDETQREQQLELLESAPTTAEYIARRRAMPYLVVDPSMPLEDMSTEDYRKARIKERAALRPTKLRMGEMSYADFLKHQKASR